METIAVLEDTNVLACHNMDALAYMQWQTAPRLEPGGVYKKWIRILSI